MLPDRTGPLLQDAGEPAARLDWLPGWLESRLLEAGLGDFAPMASRLLLVVLVVLAAMAAHFVIRGVLVRLLRRVVSHTEVGWDDALFEHKVFTRLAHLVPALIIYFGAPLIFPEEGGEGVELGQLVQRVALAYVVLASGLAFSALLGATLEIYEANFKGARERPIRSYVGVVRIVAWLIAIILIVATLMDRSPWAFLGGLGAMTAVILLVFKDAILGFVASIQIAAHDIVRVGDWVELPEYGADGDVVEITLTTVKVQNWDKTISTLPTYSLISKSVKNWRGMSESGGRRIKRAILIDQSSVRFLDEEMLARLRRIQYIQEYLDARLEEVSNWNQERKVDDQSLVNGRHLTNLGTFRAYVEAYLRNHPAIDPEMTFLVRQLPPTERGLPIEIYVFSREQRWVQYEAIQADIFDHILAAVGEFDLRVVQIPSGTDLRALIGASVPAADD